MIAAFDKAIGQCDPLGCVDQGRKAISAIKTVAGMDNLPRISEISAFASGA